MVVTEVAFDNEAILLSRLLQQCVFVFHLYYRSCRLDHFSFKLGVIIRKVLFNIFITPIHTYTTHLVFVKCNSHFKYKVDITYIQGVK